ncbi:MAG TPA: quinone-dependent dihydroorotate dehydrogenase [Roseiflexaceae bacterium]|nr:quinone-dependent dihydroorotate dehydrogenase [Roseiflexaceae bacterium]HMP39755.1 quinone-dependent dihydroorotate dehydrogenase [Roseiflexaceae bacterium]
MSLSFLYRLCRPLLFRLDAEQAHDLISGMLGRLPPALIRMLAARQPATNPALAVMCAGLSFQHPIGLAAGFDKRGTMIGAMQLLGFSHVEVGTVTPRPQPGNPRPRLFRIPQSYALINRLGFNSPGIEPVLQQLRRARAALGAEAPIIGVNIGKNRDTPLEHATDDYRAAFSALAPLADYITLNISSPNTPGLRRLHERSALEALLGDLQRTNQATMRPVPIFLKISPDENAAQIEQVVAAASANRIAGLIAGNTTTRRDRVSGPLAAETGGLSGQPLRHHARATIAQVYALTHGSMAIIGVGGVMSAADAYGHIQAGACLVQLYTGMIYGGPGLIHTMQRDLLRLLQRDGFSSITDAVGSGI